MGKSLSKLKIKSGKRNSVNGNGEAEAQGYGYRQIDVELPGGEIKTRLIYEIETAHELLENCLVNQPVDQFEVVLCFPLNKLLVIQDNTEISQYWDDIHEIKIVPKGTVVSKEADTDELNAAIHLAK